MRKARTIVGLAGAVLAHRSAGGRAGRRRGQALDRRLRGQRRSGERHQGVAHAEARPARPARAQRQAPGLGRALPARRAWSHRAARIGRATGPGWACRAGRASRGRGPGGGEGQPRRAGQHAGRDRAHVRRPDPASLLLERGRLERSPRGPRSTTPGCTSPGSATPASFYREDDDLDASSDYDVLGSNDDDVAGSIVYRSPTGSSVVTVSFLAEEYSLAGTGRCQFAGTGVVAR